MPPKESGAGSAPDQGLDSNAASSNRDYVRVITPSRRRKSSPFEDERDNNELTVNQRFVRGKLSLWECGLLNLDELAMYEYMLLKRGRTYQYATVDMPTLQSMFGSAKRVRRILNSLESKVPALFGQFVEPGKSRKLYRVVKYQDIPPTMLYRLSVYGKATEARRDKILAERLKNTASRMERGRGVKSHPIRGHKSHPV